MVKQINVDSNWKQYEKHLMTRLHQIVKGSGEGPYWLEDEKKWQLDSSNDWWATLEGGSLVVVARYPNQPLEEVMALAEKLFNRNALTCPRPSDLTDEERATQP